MAERFSGISALAPATISTDKSASKDLTLAFLVGGKIKSVSVKIGDVVKAGNVLASLDAENAVGAVNQAKGAYDTAEANYQKVINGATGTTVDVAKAAVNTTQVNLDEITKQQEVLVENAHRTLLNSFPMAQIVSDYSGNDAPTVSGTYECDKEGSYDLKTYGSSSGISVNYSGLEKGTLLLTDVPRPLGNCGLFLSFDKNKQLFSGLEFNIQIPNTNASNYDANNNAYQSALQTKEQAIAAAQAALDQANVSLESVVAGARPEDVAAAQAQVESTQGALQIAESAYNNTIITAPANGTITNVSITAGQIATPGTPAIELLSE
jgi:multidrug efflux pump subunit AcrA (membrane-fusion protein)